MYLAYLGDTPGEIIRRLFTDPSPLFETLTWPYKLVYPVLLLLPLGIVLPFLGWPALLCLPDFCINMVSSSSSFASLRHHYGTVIGVFLCAAAVHAVQRLSARATERWGGKRNALLLSIALLAVCVGAGSSGFDLGDWDPMPHHDTLARAVNMIPPDASVFCSENLIVHLVYRPNVCDNTQLRWRFPEDRRLEALTKFDYIVLDHYQAFTWGRQARQWGELLIRHPDYKILLNEDSTLLFERRDKGHMDYFWKTPEASILDFP